MIMFNSPLGLIRAKMQKLVSNKDPDLWLQGLGLRFRLR